MQHVHIVFVPLLHRLHVLFKVVELVALSERYDVLQVMAERGSKNRQQNHIQGFIIVQLISEYKVAVEITGTCYAKSQLLRTSNQPRHVCDVKPLSENISL